MFISPLNNQLGVQEGKTAHFEARVEPHDDSRLKVEWFCNGRPLTVGEFTIEIHIKSVNSHLEVGLSSYLEVANTLMHVVGKSNNMLL